MFNELTCSRFTRLSSSPCQKYLINPYNAIFLKSPGSKDIKTDIPNCQIHKYTYTNTQIQLMTKCQEYQTYVVFLNRCWFKDVKNDIPKCPESDCWLQTFALYPHVYIAYVWYSWHFNKAIFVYLYLCFWQLGISVLMSLDFGLFKNIAL